MDSQSEPTSESTGELVKTQISGPVLRISGKFVLGKTLEFAFPMSSQAICCCHWSWDQTLRTTVLEKDSEVSVIIFYYFENIWSYHLCTIGIVLYEHHKLFLW